MATTRAILTPESAEFRASSYADLTSIGSSAARPVLAFDADTDEEACWTFVVPQGWTSTFTAEIHGCMASATSGTIRLGAAVEAVTPGDSLDLDSAESYDTYNEATSGTVPGTAGYPFSTSITLTNNDSSAAGDYIRVKVRREGTDATNDTATGDFYLTAVEIRDSA